MEAKILYGLHRPFHQPLWMVKWVCAFFIRRKMKRQGCFYCKEVTADFYFVMLEWLSETYPKCYSKGIPSMTSVVAVHDEFGKLPREARYDYLKSILQKQRVSKIEKQIYSTYKASGYYINLAKEKLNLIDDNGNVTVPNFPSKYWRSSNLYQSEKIILLEQILKFDGVYFLSLCLMQKEANRFDLPFIIRKTKRSLKIKRSDSEPKTKRSLNRFLFVLVSSFFEGHILCVSCLRSFC